MQNARHFFGSKSRPVITTNRGLSKRWKPRSASDERLRCFGTAWELGSSAFLPRTGGPKRTGLSRHGYCPLRHRWPQRFWTTWSFLKYEGLKVSRCLKSIQYPDPVSVSKPEKDIEIESKEECCGAFPVTAGLHPNHLRKRKLAPSCWNKAPPTGTSSPIYLNGQTFLPGRVAESRKYCGSLHFKHLQKCS